MFVMQEITTYMYICMYVCMYIYIYIYIYIYMCVCVCVCVCMYRFIYHGGDLNLNTHRLMGTLVTVGTKIEVPMGTKASKSYRMSFFEKVKMHKVSCEG